MEYEIEATLLTPNLFEVAIGEFSGNERAPFKRTNLRQNLQITRCMQSDLIRLICFKVIENSADCNLFSHRFMVVFKSQTILQIATQKL